MWCTFNRHCYIQSNFDRNLETINQMFLSESFTYIHILSPANTSKTNYLTLNTRSEVCCPPPGHKSEWFLWWQRSFEGLTMLNDLLTFCPSLHRSVEDALKLTGGRTRPGFCNYGQTTSCCLGWRNVNGICQRRSLCDLVTAQLQWHTMQSS